MRNEGETPGPGADGQERCDCISRLMDEQLMGKHWRKNTRAAIQRGGPILAWTVILSVYGADAIASDLSLSALIS
jgi:hypothetical protein